MPADTTMGSTERPKRRSALGIVWWLISGQYLCDILARMDETRARIEREQIEADIRLAPLRAKYGIPRFGGSGAIGMYCKLRNGEYGGKDMRQTTTQDARPAACRFRLMDEGKPYPRSACSACGKTIGTGLGTFCQQVSLQMDYSPSRKLATDIAMQLNGHPAMRAEHQVAPAKGLRFKYKNYKGEVSIRRVIPMGLTFGTSYHKNSWCLNAFDLDKDALRSFAIHDMSEIEEFEP